MVEAVQWSYCQMLVTGGIRRQRVELTGQLGEIGPAVQDPFGPDELHLVVADFLLSPTTDER